MATSNFFGRTSLTFKLLALSSGCGLICEHVLSRQRSPLRGLRRFEQAETQKTQKIRKETGLGRPCGFSDSNGMSRRANSITMARW